MLNRDEGRMDGDYSDSPGYRFCKELLNVSRLLNSYAKQDKSFFKCQGDFNDAYSQLEPNMYAEEDGRPHLKLPASLCHKVDSHEETKRNLIAQLEKVETDYILKKEELMRRKTDLTNTIQIEIEKNSAQQVRDEKLYFDTFNPLNTQVHKLEEQLKLKQEEIDAKCCSGCCPFVVSKESRQLSDIKAQISLTYGKISELDKNKSSLNVDKKITELESDRKKLIDEIEKLIKQDYPAQYAQAQKALDTAIVEYKEAKAIYDSKIEHHFSLLSKETTFLYVRAYACFMQVKEQAELVWIQRFRDKQGEVSVQDVSVIFREQLNSFKSKLDELITILRSPSYSNLKIAALYSRFLTLNNDAKNLILSGKGFVALEKVLVDSLSHSAGLFSQGNKDHLKTLNAVSDSKADKVSVVTKK
jgi:TolA-binding protein